MVPLYGVNLDTLMTVVQKHTDVLESVQTMDDVQASLLRFQGSLSEIQRLTHITSIFLACIGVLMGVLMVVVIRLHIRIFQDEAEICKLVGASPFFYWSPHIVSTLFYMMTATLL